MELHNTRYFRLTQPVLNVRFDILATANRIVHDMDQLLLLSRINGDAPRANNGGGV
jgi:hypothetical protein